MRPLKLTTFSILTLGGTLLTGCLPTGNTEATAPTADEQALSSTNGMQEINGLNTVNGLSGNGLSGNGLSGNGLSGNGLILNALATTGITSSTYLMNNASGRSTLSYLIRCALPTGRTVTKQDSTGASYSFPGQIGVAPQWETGTCDSNCQELVSACLLAHVNSAGQHVAIWLDGDSPAMGWGQSTSFPYQEGSFYGNIFQSPPKAYYCNGADFDLGVVPGRLGTSGGNVPYSNQLGQGALCYMRCTWANASHDGFSSCPDANGTTFRHVVTVWRNFDPTTSYKICNKTSGKCFDTGGSTAANAAVVQRTYNGGAGQKWNVTQLSPGKFKIVSVASGKALDINGTTATDGVALVQNTYSAVTKQQWAVTSVGDGTGSNYLVPGNTTTQIASLPTTGMYNDGTAVVLGTNFVADSQRWIITVAN